jgi:hypothetical protein
LVEFVGKIEKNCGMPPTSIVHGNISDVENMHMGLFMIGLPKKGKKTQGFLCDYFLQITFTSNKFK